METPVPSIFGERKKGTLGEQRVYLINACAMLSLVRGSPLPDSIIHEVELLRDVLEECRQRPLLYLGELKVQVSVFVFQQPAFLN